MPSRALLALLALFLSVYSAVVVRADDSPEVRHTPEQETFFELRVRPILVARCLECHGEKKQEGGLRLDSREALTKAGDTGPAIVAGKPEESRLIEVIGYSDPIRMPPKGKLSDDEIVSLTEWVRLGAPFPASAARSAPALGHLATPDGIREARATHWSFQPIQRPALPEDPTGWAQTAIDRFVSAKLMAAGLKPNPRADRRTLLRRATFDLIGLPPTADEVAAFENDRSSDAFATVVDRLLASPHYGERWGRHWLDVARYADTKGYVFTEERKYPFSYTYRDYVIRALNNDLPFDRFLLEQLAADQLPLGDDKTPLAAMGFLTLGRRFGNNQNDIIDDRIDVVARGLMGLTVACARCHDHKYDPIPTDDYYSLHGVFASSIEPADLPQIGPAADVEAYRVYEQEIQKRETKLQAYQTEKHAALIDELRAHSGDYLAAIVRLEGEDPGDEKGKSIGPGEVRMSVVRRWRAFLENVSKQPHAVFGPWHALAALPAEGFGEKAGETIAALSVAADAQPRTNALVKAALQTAAPQSMADVAAVYGKLLGETHEQWVKLRESAKAGNPPAALPDPIAEELRQVVYAENNPTALTLDEARRLFDRATRNEVAKLNKEVDSYKASSPAAPPRAMVMNDADKLTQPKVLIRGNAGRPGKEVPRRFLQVLLPSDAPAFQTGSGRLELARAIASPGNPLTARVIVNRVWLHHFGEGLVRTPSDFGVRGAPPTHPELLDHLAASLIDDGWSLKRLHRRILLSAVWQQTSDDRDDASLADPENQLLWKMNRQRLEFEPLRDSLLAAAGRLDETAGGRSVDLFATPFTTRRAVYGFIDRQDLPGTLRVFDFASPDVSTPQRPDTTVPQQALFAMNSPFVVEQARRLASRPEVAGAMEPDARVQALYRLIFARQAEAEEVAAGAHFLAAPQTVELPAAAAWQNGYGLYDDFKKRTQGFTALPHFQDGAWRGGKDLPDATLGWIHITAEGGHPGGKPELAAIRRWTAPCDGVIRITATLSRGAKEGDGVRALIVSSRAGDLRRWILPHGQVETNLDGIHVVAGETIDFIVDCLTNEGHDSFAWSPTIVMAPAIATETNVRKWSAAADFRGPGTLPAPLSALEQYAQALLLTNEFVFVD